MFGNPLSEFGSERDVFRRQERQREERGEGVDGGRKRVEVVVGVEVFLCVGAAEPARDRAGRRRHPVQDQEQHALQETHERLLRPPQARAEQYQVLLTLHRVMRCGGLDLPR